MTWLTSPLIAWAAATLGLLVGALMCAAGRSDADVAADAQTSDDATAGATDTAPVKPETNAYSNPIVRPRLPPCPRCGGEPNYYYDGFGGVRIECTNCGFATSWHPTDLESIQPIEREWRSIANNYAEQNPAKADSREFGTRG